MSKEELERQKIESEIAKNNAEQNKLYSEAREVEKRLNEKWYSKSVLIKYIIAGLVSGILISVSWMSIFKNILDSKLEVIENEKKLHQIEKSKEILTYKEKLESLNLFKDNLLEKNKTYEDKITKLSNNLKILKNNYDSLLASSQLTEENKIIYRKDENTVENLIQELNSELLSLKKEKSIIALQSQQISKQLYNRISKLNVPLSQDSSLIPISNCILNWIPDNGEYRLWRFDPNQTDPIPDLVQKGAWSTIRTGHVLIPIQDYLLDWIPDNGEYRLWRFDPNQTDPIPDLVQKGAWSTIRTGHVLIPIQDYLLDWMPDNGEYRLWRFDPNQTDPLSKLVQEGTWSTIRTGHVLIPIQDYLLDWIPDNGEYRLWRFDPNQTDPLSDLVQKGAWSTIRTGHVLIPIQDYLLDWMPDNEEYRLWRFDPNQTDPLPDLVRSGILNWK